MPRYGVRVKGADGTTLVYSVNAPNPQEALRIGRFKAHRAGGLKGRLQASIVQDPLSAHSPYWGPALGPDWKPS